MDQSKISVRYAKAFISLAKEKDVLETLKKDIDIIFHLCTDSSDFRLLLESPVIKTSQKIKLFDSIFKGKIGETSLNFVKLIAENKREVHLPGICRNFIQMYKQDQGVKTAVLTSAVALDSQIINKIKSQLEVEYKAKVELSEEINPELIGGFVLRVDDQQMDASLASQLRKVKAKLLESQIK